MTDPRTRAGQRVNAVLRKVWHAMSTPRPASVSPPPGRPHPIFLEYPVKPVPRFGYGKPPHPKLYEIIDRNREAYRTLLASFLPYRDDLQRIPLLSEDVRDPSWHNAYFGGLDAVAMYCLLSQHDPPRYVEVGSGYSTKFARRAIRDHALRTHVTSIDPNPRDEIDELCDRIVRTGLEETDLRLFDELEAGDVVFFDGSHRVFMNSDVTVAFLEVLPRLRPGVLVEFHDICLPWDYPPQLSDLYYSEQYLLAAYLLAESRALEIILPNFFVCTEPELHHVLDPLWDGFTWSATATNGLSFWIRTT